MRIPLLILMCVVVGCGKKDDKASESGSSLGVPKVEPPISNYLPSALKLADFSLTDGNEEVSIRESGRKAIVGYLGTAGGNVSPVSRLKSIDARMVELDVRALASQRKCLLTAASTYTLPGTIPAGGNMPTKFQCRDDLDGSSASQIVFGLDDTNFYLMERTTPHNNAVIAIAPKSGTDVEVWQIGVDNAGAASGWTHIVGGSSSGGVEFTTAGQLVKNGSSMACGVHVKTNGTLIYAIARFPTGATICSESMTYCLKADGTETDVAACTAASITTFALTSLSDTSANLDVANAKAFINTVVTDIADFKVGVDEE